MFVIGLSFVVLCKWKLMYSVGDLWPGRAWGWYPPRWLRLAHGAGYTDIHMVAETLAYGSHFHTFLWLSFSKMVCWRLQWGNKQETNHKTNNNHWIFISQYRCIPSIKLFMRRTMMHLYHAVSVTEWLIEYVVGREVCAHPVFLWPGRWSRSQLSSQLYIQPFTQPQDQLRPFQETSTAAINAPDFPLKAQTQQKKRSFGTFFFHLYRLSLTKAWATPVRF